MNLLLHPDPAVCLGLLNSLGTPASLTSVEADGGFNLVAVNELARQYFGIKALDGVTPLNPTTARTITGSNMPETAAYLERMLANYRSVVESGSPLITESNYLTPSRETRWSRNVITPIFDGNALKRLMVTIVDVTEIRRTQQALEVSLASLVSGLVKYCESCQKVQDKSGAWLNIASYMTVAGERQFSHGICQSCISTFGMDQKP